MSVRTAAKPRAAVRQSAITRAIKAYEAAGYARGSFQVTIEPSGAIVLRPIDGDQDEAADLERRMREAFRDHVRPADVSR